MIVCPKQKIIFFHNPKTGGSSITYALAPFADKGNPNIEEEEVEKVNWASQYHHFGKHCKVEEAVRNFPGFHTDYVKFAVVRNPFDIVHSLWGKNNKGFEDFEQYVLESAWTSEVIWNQYLLLNPFDSFQIFKYEENTVWPWIKENFGKIEIPYINKTPNKNDYRDDYTEKARNHVYNCYQDDLIIWNYKF